MTHRPVKRTFQMDTMSKERKRREDTNVIEKNAVSCPAVNKMGLP